MEQKDKERAMTCTNYVHTYVWYSRYLLLLLLLCMAIIKVCCFFFVVVFYATVGPWECRKRSLFPWLWRVCGFKFLLLDAVWRVALNVVDPRSGDMVHWDWSWYWSWYWGWCWGWCWYCSSVWLRGTCVLCSLFPQVTMASFMNKQRNVVNISKFICSIYL